MKRNPYFDNARVILIFLVIFGHIIQPYIGNAKEIQTLYTWIYFFHMPAFILISGFFAKGAGDRKYIAGLFRKLIMPYLVFQLLYTGYYYLIGKGGWFNGIADPQWSLWFLVSLFSWHLLLYFFRKLKPLHGIIIAVAAGLAVGYIDAAGHTLSLSRTFVFFPFFLIGYWLKEKHLMMLKRSALKLAGAGVLAAAAVIMYFMPVVPAGWLLHSSSYASLGMPGYGGVIRLLVYAVSGIMMLSVLAWIPAKNLAMTAAGSKTLYVYLLHGFFIQYFRQADIFTVNTFIDVVGLAAISAGLLYLLSTKAVTGLVQPLTEGKTDWYKQQFEKRRAMTNQ